MVVSYRNIPRVTDMHRRSPQFTFVVADLATRMEPHVIAVAAGEDIKREIMLFSQRHPATVVLSCHGSISAVNFATPGPRGMFTYRGHFPVLSLVGSFTHNANSPDGLEGGLNVYLATPDGHIMGGRIEEFMIAATPVQVVVGTF